MLSQFGSGTFPPGQDLFWDPGSSSLKQRYQDAILLLPQLKARQQRLFLTVDWQVRHEWLMEGLVHRDISVVEQSRLLFSLDEIMALGIEHPERCLADTGGWPVLVANYDRLSQPLFRRSWQDFIAARIINVLPLRLQRILLALALPPLLTMQMQQYLVDDQSDVYLQMTRYRFAIDKCLSPVPYIPMQSFYFDFSRYHWTCE